MLLKSALVVTSISAPNPVLRSLESGALAHGWEFIVAGDTKSPEHFELEGWRFLSVADQLAGSHELAGLCPTRSYGRKNIAYWEAIAGGAKVIVETENDNFPRDAFWHPRTFPPSLAVRWISMAG